MNHIFFSEIIHNALEAEHEPIDLNSVVRFQNELYERISGGHVMLGSEPIKVRDIMSSEEYKRFSFQTRMVLLRECLHISADDLAYRSGMSPEEYVSFERCSVNNVISEDQYDSVRTAFEKANSVIPNEVFNLAFRICDMELEFSADERKILSTAIDRANKGHRGMLERIHNKYVTGKVDA